MPQFTVVLPVYNGAAYIAESLASVLNQTFEDFEVIICDDGSTDQTFAICESVSDPRIRLLRNERNQGLFPTLNRAIRTGTAPLLRLWSQDDRMKAHCLAAEHLFWTAHPDLGMSYCQRDTIDARGIVVRRAEIDETPEVLSMAAVAWISFYYGCMPGNIATVTLSRDAFERAGGFREDFLVAGDFDLWIRIAERHPTGFVRQSLVELRDHGDQFSRRPDTVVPFMVEIDQVIERLSRYLPEALRRDMHRLNRRLRHVPYHHAMIRAACRGDLATAVQAYRFLSTCDSPVLIAAWWLASGNNRWWPVAPSYPPAGIAPSALRTPRISGTIKGFLPVL